MLELGVADLRFDLGETRQLLRKGDLGTALSDDATVLHTLTGGWIAALRAALLTLHIQNNPSQYLQQLPASLRSINTLFADLVDQLPPDLANFMERISVTERQCAALAERLTGRADAQAMLVRLEKQQMFFSPQDEHDQWFAFHPLFREFLQRRVRERGENRLQGAHGEAARWFAGERLWSEAIHHGLAAGEIGVALHWIEEHAMAAVGAGDLLTLLAWERQLRSHLVRSPPQLRLAFAWGLGLAMACDKALTLLDGVEAELDQSAPGGGEALRRECQALRSVLVMLTGDYELGEKLAEECLAIPSRQPWVPNAIRNVIAAAHLHAGRWERLYATPPLLGDLYEARAGDRMSLVYRLSIRGLAEYRQGHLDEAARLLEEAMDMGSSAGSRSAVLKALPAPTLALVRYEQDRIRDAASINAEYLDINKRVGNIQALLGSYQVAARVARLEGQPLKARSLLDEAESIGAARGWRRVEVGMLLEKVRVCLLDGRGTEASACVQRIETLAADSVGSPNLESVDFGQVAALTRAWLQLADRCFESAAEVLEAQLTEICGSGRLLDEIRITTALALAKFGSGKTDAAIRLFSQACNSACAVGALRSILDQPVPVDGLISALRADAAEMVAHPGLNGFLDDLSRATREPSRPSACASIVESLSPRERHILGLMADGQSNKEIARSLGIGSETVKSHVKKIFSKLGVQNRAQAAALATDDLPSAPHKGR